MKGNMLGRLTLSLLFSPLMAWSQSASKPQKITMTAARKIALARESGVIKSAELEKEKGKLIYSFDVQMPDGIHEVNVDAHSGEVVEDSVESPAAEAKEKAQENKH